MDVTGQIKKVLWLVLLANVSVAAVKLILGHQIESASLTADGYHSLTDGVSNVIGLVGIMLAAKPTDSSHPYGHKKYECLTGLIISAMLFSIAAQIVIDAIRRLDRPTSIEVTSLNLMLLLVTLVINLAVCIGEYRVGQRLNSYILISDSLHTKSDIYVSVGVIAALLLMMLGAPPFIDPLVSLVVAGLILTAAYSVGKSTVDVLVDAAVVDVSVVRAVALTFPAVLDVHKVRSRGSRSDMYLDMHIVIQPEVSVKASHELVHAIELLLKQKICNNLQVLIHVEPYYERPIGLERLFARSKQ